MLKFQMFLIAVLVACFTFVSCERAQQIVTPATDDMMEKATEPTDDTVDKTGTEAGTSDPDTEAGTSDPDTEAGTSDPNTEAGTDDPDTEAGTDDPDTEAGTANTAGGGDDTGGDVQ